MIVVFHDAEGRCVAVHPIADGEDADMYAQSIIAAHPECASYEVIDNEPR